MCDLALSPVDRRWMSPNGFSDIHPRSTFLDPHNLISGDEGTRTPDLLLAKEALSRLSYIPRSYFSGPFRART